MNKKIVYSILSLLLIVVVLIVVVYFKFIRPITRSYKAGYSGIVTYSNKVNLIQVNFIQWTEYHNKLTGQLVSTMLNNDKIHSQHFSFTGIRTKNKITLNFKYYFKYFFSFNKGSTRITGKISGNEFVLNVPTSTSIRSVIFKYSHISKYEAVVSMFKKIAYKRKQKIIAIHKYNQKLRKINNILGNLIGDIKNTDIPEDISSLKNYLTNEYSDLNTMKENFALELQNIHNANNTHSCYELVNVAGYDYKSLLKYDYFSLIMYNKHLFDSTEHNIEKRFINGETLVNKSRLVIQKLKDLESADKYPLPKSTFFYKFITPQEANHGIGIYKSTIANAKNLLPKLETVNTGNVKHARDILKKGGNIYKESLASTNCQ